MRDDAQRLDLESFLSSCPWIAANSYDWIYMTPAIIVLFVNVLFLVKIMWVSRPCVCECVWSLMLPTNG